MDPSLTDPGIVDWSQPAPPPSDMDPIGNFSLPPSNGSTHNYTSYPEMITAAITALGEPEGSSRQAIAKYIEQTFANLPDNNAVLLTRYLKQLKQTGQLEMVKHSYVLPGSVPVFSHSEQLPAENEAYAAVAADSASGMKRRPGRPPKLKTGNQPAAAGDAHPIPVQESVFVSLGLVDEPAPPALTLGKRGRGRPPKSQSTAAPEGQNDTALAEIFPVGENGTRRGPGRPRKMGSIGISSPPSNAIGLTSRPRGSKPRKVAKPGGRPRGRPRKYAILPALEDGGTSQVVGGGITPAKRRGRLPMAGILLKKTRRSLSGKPLGRPRKNVANQQTQQTHGDYTKKLEHIHLKVKEVIDVVKPHLNPLTASIAIVALQELEQFTQFSSSSPHVVQHQRAAPTVTTTHVVSAEPSPHLTTTTHMASEQQAPVLTTTTAGQEQAHFLNASSHFGVPSMFPGFPSQFQAASYPARTDQM